MSENSVQSDQNSVTSHSGDSLTREKLFERLRPPQEGPELFIGLVAPVGAGKGDVTEKLIDEIERQDYDAKKLKLSDRIDDIEDIVNTELLDSPEDERIKSYQEAANDVRKQFERNDALVGLTCLKIREYRNKQTDKFEQVPRQAYILDSLKTPAEVEKLRQIYGDGFVLIGVYAPQEVRRQRLAERIAMDRDSLRLYELGDDEDIDASADDIINLDRGGSGHTYRQNVGKTFPKSDIFIDATELEKIEEQIGRVVDLIFGSASETPTEEEQCMYIADGARFRSSSSSRQVGAALARPNGEVVSIGCNEVPKAGGGQYWTSNKRDFRDFRLDTDLTQRKRMDTLRQVLEKLDETDVINPESLGEGNMGTVADVGDEELYDLLEKLDDTRLAGLIEFYRATHAEMGALFSAGRKGIPVDDTILYSTTFPCHECTRHIVTAGVERVVYIEPYPKSLGDFLHGDAINAEGISPSSEFWDEKNTGDDKVSFEPFSGIGPRIYDEVFDSSNRQADTTTPEDEVNRMPTFAVDHVGWFSEEQNVIEDMNQQLNKIGNHS